MHNCLKCAYEFGIELTSCPNCNFPTQGPEHLVATVPRDSSERMSVQPTHVTRLGSVSVPRPAEVVRKTIVLLVVLFDLSLSMRGKKSKRAKNGIHLLADPLQEIPPGQCEFGIVGYNDTARVVRALSPPSSLKGIDFGKPDGMTNITEALSLGGNLLANHPSSHIATKLLLAMTDGHETCTSDDLVLEEAAKQKEDGNIIISVGYGSDADNDLLRQVASSKDLHFKKGVKGGELETFFHDLGTSVSNSLHRGLNMTQTLKDMA